MRLSCPPGCSRLYEAHRKLLAFKIADNLTPLCRYYGYFLPEAAAPPFMEKVPVCPVGKCDQDGLMINDFQPAAVDNSGCRVIGFGQQLIFSSAVG